MTNEKKNNGYIINHDEQTITITKDYAKRSSVPGSKEFRELITIIGLEYLEENRFMRKAANMLKGAVDVVK